MIRFRAGDFEILLDVGFVVFRARSKDGLDAVAHGDDAGRAERSQFPRIHLGDVVQFHPQPRDAGIERSDVAPSAEGAHDLQGEVFRDCIFRFRGGRLLGFAAGRFEIELHDREAKDAVIKRSPDRAENEEPAGLVRLREEDDEIDQAMRKRHAVFDPEQNAKAVSRARKDGVDEIENRREKQERELDRLGDSSEERGQRRRDHDPADLGPILRACAAPHRHRGGGQAPHFEKITAGHVARGRIARDESIHFPARNHAGHRVGILPDLEKERDVPDVMQAERNEETLDESVKGKRDHWLPG